MKRTRDLFHGGLLLLFFLSACVNITKSFPDKRHYILDVSNHSGAMNGATGPSLRIRKLRVSPRFAGKEIVYRRGDLTYESDFYNEFLIPPGSLLTEEVSQWLARSGLFHYVTETATQLQPIHILEGTVSALYGDFRNGIAPLAILEMEFFLTRDLSSRSEIIFRKEYAERVPLKEGSPESLVRGWNDGLRRILTALEDDLKGIDFQTNGAHTPPL